MLATICGRFRLELAPEMGGVAGVLEKQISSFTLAVDGGLHMHFHHRAQVPAPLNSPGLTFFSIVKSQRRHLVLPRCPASLPAVRCLLCLHVSLRSQQLLMCGDLFEWRLSLHPGRFLRTQRLIRQDQGSSACYHCLLDSRRGPHASEGQQQYACTDVTPLSSLALVLGDDSVSAAHCRSFKRRHRRRREWAWAAQQTADLQRARPLASRAAAHGRSSTSLPRHGARRRAPRNHSGAERGGEKNNR